MTNPYNPIALKPIDYATPLQNVYAEQSSALDRYHAQLRERDRQEEAATLNLPEIFSKLASFSQKIASAKQAHDTGKAEQTAADNAEIEWRRAEAKVDDERINKAVEKLKDIQLKQQKLRKAFVSEKNPKKKERLKQALIKMHKLVKNAESEFNNALIS